VFLLVPAHPGSPGPTAVKRLCVCVCVCVCAYALFTDAELRIFVPRVSAAHERRTVARRVEVVQHEVAEVPVELRVQETLDSRRVLRVGARVDRSRLTSPRRRHETLMSVGIFECSTAWICSTVDNAFIISSVDCLKQTRDSLQYELSTATCQC